MVKKRRRFERTLAAADSAYRVTDGGHIQQSTHNCFSRPRNTSSCFAAGTLLFLPLVKTIPMSVLFGLFLYMGITTLAGNEFFERVKMWAMDPELYPTTHPFMGKVPIPVIKAYTAVQVVCLAALWILKSSALGLLFPILIGLLVPIRNSLTRFFSEEHLAALDGEEEAAIREDAGGGGLGL